MSAALMDGAVLSPQLTATTIRFPAVVLAPKAWEMEELDESFVDPAVWIKLIATPAAVTVRVVDPETEPEVALIVVEPVPTLLANP